MPRFAQRGPHGLRLPDTWLPSDLPNLFAWYRSDAQNIVGGTNGVQPLATSWTDRNARTC
jgi:hypothetical protein